MKKILFLLLCTVSIYGQTSTGQEQEFDYGIKNNSLQTITTPTYIGTFGTDGTQGKIPSAYIAKTAAVQDSLNKKINLPTGFLQGLQLSINADPTKFNIAAGYYVVTDFTNLTQPVVKIINYAGATGLTPAYLATSNSTYIALDINGAVVSSASPFTDAQRRTLVIVGNVVHSNNTTINVTNEIKAPIVAVGNQLHDFMKAIGFLNESGNVYSANGANLQINKSVGDIFGMGINASDYLSPHKLTIPSQTALTFAYRFQNGTQLADTQNINPNIYDVGGTSTATPSNKWTIQRINLFQSGLSRIQPGQTVYNSFNDAVVALPTQPFVTEQNIADNAVFRCYLIVQQGTTNLASAVAGGSAQFVPVDKFGNIIGNGSVALTYSNIVAALGFTPENVVNKSDSYTASSSTTYASTKALVDGLATKIGGTLTSGYIPKATGTSTLGNSLIYDDGTSIGIGTTSPTAKLYVSGSIKAQSVSSSGLGVIDSNTNYRMWESGNAKYGIGTNQNGGLEIMANQSGGAVKIYSSTENTSPTLSATFLGSTSTFTGTVTASNFNGSATLTGTPTAPTATVGTNTTQIATMEALQAANAGNVKTTGDQTIAGTKTFTGAINSGAPPTNNDESGGFFYMSQDGNGSGYGSMYFMAQDGYSYDGFGTATLSVNPEETYLERSNLDRSSYSSLRLYNGNTSLYSFGTNSIVSLATYGTGSYVKLDSNDVRLGTDSASIVTAPTAAPGTTGNQIATLDYVLANTTARSYKVYTALLSQTGTSAPTATVLENTLGGTVVWTRSGIGSYQATLTGSVYTSSKTVVFATIGLNKNLVINGARVSDSVVSIMAGTGELDSTNMSIEIRVYN